MSEQGIAPEQISAVAPAGYFSWEYRDCDLPYYRGQPLALAPAQWWLLILLVLAGFACLVAPATLFQTEAGQFIPVLLFLGLPLAGLRHVARQEWSALFRALTWRDLRWVPGFVLLNLLVSVAIGWFVSVFVGAAPNPLVQHLPQLGPTQQVLFFLRTLPQLLGEELFTVLPMLALLHWLHVRRGMARRAALAWVWGLGALWFGVAHLPTYDWNLLQCILVIGSVRLVLTWAFLLTRNLWVSFGVHVLSDWSIFTVTLLSAGA